MTTLPSSRIRGCNASDKWPSRAVDNRQKSSNIAFVSSNNCCRNVHPNNLQVTASNSYQKNCNSERDIKFPETRTSEETVNEEEVNVNKNNLHDYPDESANVKPAPRRNGGILRRQYQGVDDYPELDMPEATTAMQKLQRLKELQRRRDLSERYYTQEIKRLIGEHCLGSRMTLPTLRINQKLQNASLQPYSGDRAKNSLEPCGTMTTITRLDCGCVQETTRPIFTTARGRVQKKNCSQSQDEVLLKSTSSNPQEHLLSSMNPQKDRNCAKSKKRLSLDPRMRTKIPPGLSRVLEVESNQRTDTRSSEVPGRTSRNGSPSRKCSDTSSISI